MAVRRVRSVREVQRLVRGWKAKGLSIGLVPTMGALHAGHLSLFRTARRRADRVVISLFVNPKQFDDSGDYTAYPRPIKADQAKAQQAGADLLFVPSIQEIYPSGFETVVEVRNITRRWEGAERPGHFRGVTTVVAKLFGIIQPDLAFFGQKDYQQGMAIRTMVRDLSLPVRIVLLPTVREKDGLAISSRNVRLSPKGRALAPQLYRALTLARELFAKGERNAGRIQGSISRRLAKFPELEVDYVGLCHPESLEPVERAVRGTVVLSAVRLEGIRLIDNIQLR